MLLTLTCPAGKTGTTPNYQVKRSNQCLERLCKRDGGLELDMGGKGGNAKVREGRLKDTFIHI